VKNEWFHTLMDAAPEVYFRYAFAPARAFVYVSRGIQELTGYTADAFVSDPAFCVSLVVREDRRVLRQMVRARRALTTTLRLKHQDGTIAHLQIRTVPVISSGRDRKLVALEGVASAIVEQPPLAFPPADAALEPVQQRLYALLTEVHQLLHGHLPAPARLASTTLRIADIVLDTDRMTATLGGEAVALTSRELLVLRYFLERPGRVVTREQLLQEVWGLRYTGDARTVDVHVSRLRSKLPPLRAFLRAIKHVGYRLDAPATAEDVRHVAS